MKKKKCTKCKIIKPISEFNRESRNKDKPRSWCKSCYKEYNQKYAPQWYRSEAHKKRLWEKAVERNYPGMTVSRYEEILESQNGVCAICGKPGINRRLAVDHNHKTGQIRGLLCVFCNVLVGYVEERTLLRKIETYLKKFKE